VNTGRLITVEGGEGVGKSTNLAFIRERLEQAGRPVVATREPGGTALGERLREVLLAPDESTIDPEAELLLMFAARVQHLRELIEPALQRGDWAVFDRFTDASYAYQGGGCGLAASRIAALEDWVQGDLRPDRVIVLDAPADVGLARAGRRGAADRFERERADFFERVRAVYLQRAAAEPARYRVVDAARPLDRVREALDAVVRECLNSFQ
jgi:dTMP kinase